MDLLASVRKETPELSVLNGLLTVLEDRINTLFEDVVRAVATAMQARLKGRVFAPQNISAQFWVDVQSRYGRGPGYRDDVLSMYQDQLSEVGGYLATITNESWQKLLIDPIIRYLG